MNIKIILVIFLFFLIPHKIVGLEVTLTEGTIKPTPIAVTDFFSKDSKYNKIGKNIALVISDNLERSGLFLPIDNKSFIQNIESLANRPRFEDWKIIKAQHLISGKVSSQNDRITVEFRLYDIFAQKQLIGKKYETSKKNWRRVSHIISDTIYQRITGEGGYFDTRIVYVAETGSKGNRQFDGKNQGKCFKRGRKYHLRV